MDPILKIQCELNDCALINPFLEKGDFNDNKKRYKSTLAKLLAKGYGVYMLLQPNIGFFVSSRGKDTLQEDIRSISSDLKTDKFHLIYKNTSDPVLNAIKSQVREALLPNTGFGNWSLQLAAKKKWQDLDT